MTSNTAFMRVGERMPSWIELYNPSDSTIDLNDYKLRINWGRPFQIRSVELPAGERLVILLPENKKLATGDRVWLLDSEFCLVDSLTTEAHKDNHSIWRSKNAAGECKSKESKTPSPQFSDDAAGAAEYVESLVVENTCGLFINEVLASNATAYRNEAGETVDYVEIINTSRDSVDLSGFGISDRIDLPYKFSFEKGEILAPGEVKLVELNDFSIKKGKEGVFLSNNMTEVIDQIPLVKTHSDQGLVRLADGRIVETVNLSPGLPNTPEGAKTYAATRKALIFNDSPLCISEGMSRNTLYAPVKGKYYDWLEIYNRSDSTVCLKGWKLSDGKHEFVFGDGELGAGEYFVIYASEDELVGVVNAGFDLNGNCEAYLYDADGAQADVIGLSELTLNLSKGRDESCEHWIYLTKPSPGAANAGPSYTRIADAPLASRGSGRYGAAALEADAASVASDAASGASATSSGASAETRHIPEKGFKIALEGEGSIRYTTDGSVPTRTSTLYKDSISIDKTCVIRAICFADDAVASPVATYNYILDRRHTLDVLCLASDPDGLYSYENGIFATGPGAGEESPFFGANFWKDWRRRTNVEFLPVEGEGFNADAELKIFGGYTRAIPKKSTKIKFKDIYGTSKLKYPNLFSTRDIDEFDELVVRTGGQDTYKAMLRDDVISYLADTLMLHNTMASRPLVLYINGSYEGVFYLREKINEDYVAAHYGISPESVDLVQGYRKLEAGSLDGWLKLLDYVRNHNLASPECYEYVCERMDVQNYADFVITEMFIENGDLGNVRVFRSPEIDGKWRWILYDTDMSFTARENTEAGAYAVLNPAGIKEWGLMYQTVLINGLLKNKEFRALFVDRMEYQMKNVWTEERMLAAIDYFLDMVGDELPSDRRRWGYSVENWEKQVASLRRYVKTRQARLRHELETESNTRSVLALTKAELDRIFGD